MKRKYHTITVVSAAVFAVSAFASCIYDDESAPADTDQTIGVNVAEVSSGSGHRVGENSDNKFEVVFWLDEHTAKLGNPADGDAITAPYLAREAPQPVSYYNQSVYDTGYPYPYPEETKVYATGYAPSNFLSASDNYTKLTVDFKGEKNQKIGRYDFLGCDFWREVYKGSQEDPFAQEKNRLYFRHLAAKLVFYADRDKVSMENKQFVRDVQIKNLEMKVGDREWIPMHTPSEFAWSKLEDKDFTASYEKTITEIKALAGNAGVTSRPSSGYKILNSEPFTGIDNYVLKRSSSADRVPISGMVIDSCFVCNHIVDGVPATGKIQLRMDISAQLSFDIEFPNNNGITFTHEWTGVILGAINEMEPDGNGVMKPTDAPVDEFKPGNEYRVYIHFNRTGVNLVGEELPWNPGGVHYITIDGGSKENQTNE